MSDLNFSVVVNLVDYPPRLDGPAGNALAGVLSNVATEMVRAQAKDYDATHDDAHRASSMEDRIIARLDAAAAETTAVGYRHRLIQVAGLALSATLRWDRLNPATTDPEQPNG